MSSKKRSQIRDEEFLTFFPWTKSIGSSLVWILLFTSLYLGVVSIFDVLTGRSFPVPAGMSFGQCYGPTAGFLRAAMRMITGWMPVLAWFWKVRDPLSGQPKLPRLLRPSWRGIVAVLGWALFGAMASILTQRGVSCLRWLLGYVDLKDPVAGLLTEGSPWLMGSLIGLVAPVLEEMFFRGIALNVLRASLLRSQHAAIRRNGTVIALITSGLLFAAMHQNNPAFLQYTASGLIYGFVYTRSRRLSAAIAAHGLSNLGSEAGRALFWS